MHAKELVPVLIDNLKAAVKIDEPHLDQVSNFKLYTLNPITELGTEMSTEALPLLLEMLEKTDSNAILPTIGKIGISLCSTISKFKDRADEIIPVLDRKLNSLTSYSEVNPEFYAEIFDTLGSMNTEAALTIFNKYFDEKTGKPENLTISTIRDQIQHDKQRLERSINEGTTKVVDDWRIKKQIALAQR